LETVILKNTIRGALIDLPRTTHVAAQEAIKALDRLRAGSTHGTISLLPIHLRQKKNEEFVHTCLLFRLDPLAMISDTTEPLR
jgi:hypothetical protein